MNAFPGRFTGSPGAAPSTGPRSIASLSTGASSMGALSVVAALAVAAAPLLAEETFDKIHEPSGVARLEDGRLVVVEDEARRPMRLVAVMADDGESAATPGVGSIRLGDERRLRPARGPEAGVDVGELDDLEGIARDAAGRLYVVGSHDDAEKRRTSDRQKLVRFAVGDDRTVDAVMTRRLRHDLLAAYPAIAYAIADGGKTDGALNIEALAFDRRRGHLLIGLRTPRLDDDAVIVRLTNPDAYLEGTAAATFDDAPWTLDLDRGGLRALAYDDRSDRLLAVSRRESGGGGAFKLWRLAADGRSSPVRVRLDDEDDPFDDVEGLVPLDDREAILFVRDDGRRDDREGGAWFTVPRQRLGLD